MRWPHPGLLQFCLPLCLFLLIISSVVFLPICLAANQFSFERLISLSGRLQTPTGLAVDGRGRLYVAETTEKKVLIFSQGGRFLKEISELGEPVCVAVAANGRIFIGDKKNGSVSVYNTDLELLFKLGRGDGEFVAPVAVAVDDAGKKIFVADRETSTVRMFNWDGSANGILGQPGNGSGQFHHPVSIAVDAARGEIIVLDWQETKDIRSNTMINGARIQYFDRIGKFLRAYSKFGYNFDAGMLIRPIHLAVDSASRLYVTDSRQQKVVVYDTNNTFLGRLDDTAPNLRTPLGVAIGSSNLLYVSSLLSRRVEVYGIGQHTAMEISPVSLSFSAIAGGSNPLPQTTTISNKGNSALEWSARSENSWLGLSSTSGTIDISASQTLDVSVSLEGLTPATYRDTIEIANGTGSTESVDVVLTVKPNPVQVHPTSLTFDAETGTTPPGRAIAVSTGYADPVNWKASVDQAWLSVTKASGTTPESIRVYVASDNLPADSYTGFITFTDSSDTPVPVKVAVTLNLTESSTPPVPPPGPTTGHPGQGQGNANKYWTMTQVQPGTSLNGIWGTPARDMFAVGAGGAVFHLQGAKWRAMDTGTDIALRSAWGSSGKNVYAVGDAGTVLHYDGKTWTQVKAATQNTLHDVSGSKSNAFAVDAFGAILRNAFGETYDSGVALRGIWVNSDTDIFVVGEAGKVFRYDGSSWTGMVSNTSRLLHDVWGVSGKDIFAVGEKGTIIRFDGIHWRIMDSGTTETLHAVWGSSGKDVYAVGSKGVILHFNGSAWTPLKTEAKVTLNDVWVSPNSEVYAVGEDGYIIKGRNKFPWMHFAATTIRSIAAKKSAADGNADKPPLPQTSTPKEAKQGSRP